jgi:LAS superfamily LD-carboxypeptidase LdcB
MRRAPAPTMPEAVDAAALFDAAVAVRDDDLAALGFDVVARPGTPPIGVRGGDLLVRRALGDGRLAVLAAVQSRPGARAVFEARGVPCQGRGEGLFVEVYPGGGGPSRAVPIADARGGLSRDTVLLRARRAPAAPFAETEPTPEQLRLREEARRRFGIPGMGVQSGRPDYDGWAPHGRQHPALTKSNQTIPERITEHLAAHPAGVTHLRQTLALFASGSPVLPASIDLPLVLAIAARETLPLRRVFSDEATAVITAGRDTHPQGVSGLDFIFDSHELFPAAIRAQVQLVRAGYRPGREDRRAAQLPERYLLAAFVVAVEAGRRGFERQVRRVFAASANALVAALAPDARRAWIALSFSGVGYVYRALERLRGGAGAPPPDLLGRLLVDPASIAGNFHVQSAVVTSARAWMLDRVLAPELIARPGGRPSGAQPEEGPPAELLLAALFALRSRRRRTVSEEYLRSRYQPATGTPPLGGELNRAATELEGRLPGLRDAALQAALDELAGRLLAAAERAFILDPERSILELLAPAGRDRYLRFAWDPADFPGGPPGPNEARADEMFSALTALRPERRANQGAAAVVQAAEATEEMRRQIEGALAPVPGQTGLRLHREAAAAFERMRAAAAAEGVTLVIGNAYRTPERAAAAAARAGNRAAVASFSSHSLGLAVDLDVSHGGLRLRETSTRPFQNLVDMYRSPVHKWTFLRGEEHGFYPYRREPWHWEYNPPGFRERFRRAAPAPAPGPSRAELLAEVASDPVTPVLPPLSLGGSVGRGGRNQPPDVTRVQERLVQLRALSAADATAERPASSGSAVPESALARTIAAIEAFQRRLGMSADGGVSARGPTQIELDRCIPEPTAAEYAAVATRRAATTEVVSRGARLTGPVGATSSGNAPDDVRVVQRRLVELGRLAASHGEEPPAGATGAVAQAGLRATLRALREFQSREVQFWLDRGTVTGRITSGVVAPGDATAALLDRIAVYTMTAGTNRITLRDHVRSGYTESEAGVSFRGSASPDAIPAADYVALGLTADQAAALRFVSRHEGNFDAINTYDRAVVSVGFIQFAGGGRGLGPYLALLRSRQPAVFRRVLGEQGIEIEFSVSGGEVDSHRVAVLDPDGRRVLRGADAEAAVRGNKRLTTAFILSGRERDVQLVQIEAAIRDYVTAALGERVTWGSASAPLGDLLRSQKGMAALFDRAIQEGVGAARRRFERVIRAVHAARPAASTAQMQAREADVRAELERDLRAGAAVAARLEAARSALGGLRRQGGSGATVAGLLARPELAEARRALGDARASLATVVYVSPPRGSSVEARLAELGSSLGAEATRLAFAPPPGTVALLVAAVTESQRELGRAIGPFSTASAFLNRIEGVRSSTLTESLDESAVAVGPMDAPLEGEV